jgi:hypothetical protein
MNRNALCLLGSLFLITTALAAQQGGPTVQLGVVRVPSCPPASDPEYGLVQTKAIQIGGGPMYMSARQRNYLNALRGPQGQVLRIGDSIGSGMLNINGPDRVIIDSYTVSYEGENGPVGKVIYMDAYHYEAPKVPAGFTCGAPLATAVPIPPADPMKMSPAILSLAVERGTKTDVPPISLDASVARGYFFDHFATVALRARAAAVAGSPLDSEKPSKDLDANGTAVLAYPVSCGDRSIAPAKVELLAARGPIDRESTDVLQGEALAKAFPGLPTPAGSIGLRFRNASPAQARITYAEGCNGASPETMVSFRAEPPRLIEMVPGTRPAGVVEAEPVVYIQVVIDPDGKVARTEYLGGPRSLYPAALEALAKWKVQPTRVNGTGVVTTNVLQVPFP